MENDVGMIQKQDSLESLNLIVEWWLDGFLITLFGLYIHSIARLLSQDSPPCVSFSHALTPIADRLSFILRAGFNNVEQ